ncbi:PREDICTED: uncharacterized protein LOC104602177 [Nelumbo nucifera]|uniref:Uncharacterized protein LOC104602177 n=2 Tax=Nelumbo nucifera TaxID=4432 RepID=A0A1U8AMW6_NELNU|nr:PREDICTED: uncharacterized protein LOC104602177 [Nelumbo nucifera]XP_010264095.1 PREDICTED: uncharacterized protein LOC104602177 [Nelumbo nucifera]DAD35369.1 TPA_asm: hypothetical protein HUJ06_006009 [Nelumbo nucifera]
MVSKTRNMLEGLVREGSFKWLLGNRSPFDEEFEEMSKSPSARTNWMPELSPIANVVVRRCSRILEISMDELRNNFDAEASDSIKHSSGYARNFLEYCCFRALALSVQVTGYLADKKFRRLTFDMMLAWEAPSASSQPLLKVDEESTVSGDSFSRIAPAIPIIADVITCDNLFDVLTTSTGGRLQFSVYEKYLNGLERAIRKLKTQSESSLLSALRSPKGERILELDGTVTTQPVLQHVGVSTWPGRLILTDHALYFEPLRVVTFDKPKTYDLSDDLKQVVKPELTGPWGTRIFDKAIMYKSISVPESVIMEFPELKGHTRRDYWLAIIREILYAHQFIRKFQIKGVQRDEALSKATLGILRLQALQEFSHASSVRGEAFLMFNLCDQLPGGDLILETLARMSTSRELDRTNSSTAKSGMYSISAFTMMSNLGVTLGMGSTVPNETGLVVGEIVVGEMTALERAVREARSSFKKVELAQASIDGVKVEGLDTNLVVMKELLFPVIELVKYLLFLISWDDPIRSLVFCCASAYTIYRGWLGYALALLFLFIAIFMVLTRCCSQGKPVDEVKVTAPPTMNTMEQILAVQNAVSQIEEFIQEGNVVLLKLRALLLSVFPQASERVAFGLLLVAFVLAFIPCKYIVLLIFLEMSTRYSPLRKASTERWERRLREWWFSIPAAPVLLERTKEEKKRE